MRFTVGGAQLPELPNVIDIKVTTEMVNDGTERDEGTGDTTSIQATDSERMGAKQYGRLTPP